MAVTDPIANSLYTIKVMYSDSNEGLEIDINAYLSAGWELLYVDMASTPVDPSDESVADQHFFAIIRKLI
jgi:hypothetical protein